MAQTISAIKSLDHIIDNPRYNPPRAKFKDISLFQINLDRKTILCRECDKTAPLSNTYMTNKVIQEVDNFKKLHSKCITIHKKKLEKIKKRRR